MLKENDLKSMSIDHFGAILSIDRRGLKINFVYLLFQSALINGELPFFNKKNFKQLPTVFVARILLAISQNYFLG